MGKQRRNRERFYRQDNPVKSMKHLGVRQVPILGRCEADQGKAIYKTRAEAKVACKSHTLTHPVEPYRCTVVEGWWHVGGKTRDPRLKYGTAE